MAKQAEEKLNDALQLMRDAYRQHVRDRAEDIAELIGDEITDRDNFFDRVHEEVDSDAWVIYTNVAQAIVLSYAALEQDIFEQLNAMGYDINDDATFEPKRKRKRR